MWLIQLNNLIYILCGISFSVCIFIVVILFKNNLILSLITESKPSGTILRTRTMLPFAYDLVYFLAWHQHLSIGYSSQWNFGMYVHVSSTDNYFTYYSFTALKIIIFLKFLYHVFSNHLLCRLPSPPTPSSFPRGFLQEESSPEPLH